MFPSAENNNSDVDMSVELGGGENVEPSAFSEENQMLRKNLDDGLLNFYTVFEYGANLCLLKSC